ncbi:MAG: hypothetical protein QOF86_1415 [Baekduia sp.]|jgi:hypothetical protein|nr:hypothetical protein [Baekduia sp.]
MARRFVAAVGRAFSARPATSTITQDPHFHQGAQGNVAACFAAHCDRPRLDA